MLMIPELLPDTNGVPIDRPCLCRPGPVPLPGKFEPREDTLMVSRDAVGQIRPQIHRRRSTITSPTILKFEYADPNVHAETVRIKASVGRLLVRPGFGRC